ncbi:MAG: hypothetical protein LBR33_04330 [Propionibacteriaceae bacterium]|jgi:hypothetical protein|nr:hypothetical protein [Propionibacteriaceae bacterium]
MAHRVFTNLDLHEEVPVRARPAIGEWGPKHVPTTGQKRRARILAPILFVLAAAAIFTLGYWVFQQIAQAVGL